MPRGHDFLPLKAVHTERGEDRRAERHDEEDHAGRAGLLHVRHDGPPQMVERRRRPQRDQEKQRADPGGPPYKPAAPISQSENRERDDRKPEVLGMQFERIRAPIRLEGSAGEAGDDELGDVVPGDAVRRRSLITNCIPPCPGRVGDVLNKGQDLWHRDAEADNDRG